MAVPSGLEGINPLASIGLGNMSTLGAILLVIALAVVICGLVAGIILIFFVKKKYWIRIHVFKLVGNTPTRMAIYSARQVPMGMAGDMLWRVAPLGMMKFQTIKWLPVGKYQSAPNEFWYWLREDGEWINFKNENIDELSRTMKIKFVQEDMRLQRLATDRLLEQRLMNKSFWEKWKETIMLIIFFLVVAICMVIIFYQFSKVIDKMAPLVDGISKSLDIVQRTCGLNITQGGSTGGLIPVS